MAAAEEVGVAAELYPEATAPPEYAKIEAETPKNAEKCTNGLEQHVNADNHKVLVTVHFVGPDCKLEEGIRPAGEPHSRCLRFCWSGRAQVRQLVHGVCGQLDQHRGTVLRVSTRDAHFDAFVEQSDADWLEPDGTYSVHVGGAVLKKPAPPSCVVRCHRLFSLRRIFRFSIWLDLLVHLLACLVSLTRSRDAIWLLLIFTNLEMLLCSKALHAMDRHSLSLLAPMLMSKMLQVTMSGFLWINVSFHIYDQGFHYNGLEVPLTLYNLALCAVLVGGAIKIYLMRTRKN